MGVTAVSESLCTLLGCVLASEPRTGVRKNAHLLRSKNREAVVCRQNANVPSAVTFRAGVFSSILQLLGLPIVYQAMVPNAIQGCEHISLERWTNQAPYEIELWLPTIMTRCPRVTLGIYND